MVYSFVKLLNSYTGGDKHWENIGESHARRSSNLSSNAKPELEVRGAVKKKAACIR
jgi:hypothetical protein